MQFYNFVQLLKLLFVISVFLGSIQDILKVALEAARDPSSSEEVKDKFYDDISFNLSGTSGPGSHLLDHVSNIQPADEDFVTIQYQFITVALIIWTFGLDHLKVRKNIVKTTSTLDSSMI